MSGDPNVALRVLSEDRLVIVFLAGGVQEHSLNPVHHEADEEQRAAEPQIVAMRNETHLCATQNCP
jgi:hypothetical protein